MSVNLSSWPTEVKLVSKTISLDTNKQDTVEHYSNLNAFLNYINDIDVKDVVSPILDNLLFILAIVLSVFGAIYIPTVISNGLLSPEYIIEPILCFLTAIIFALGSTKFLNVEIMLNSLMKLGSVIMFSLAPIIARGRIRIDKENRRNAFKEGKKDIKTV